MKRVFGLADGNNFYVSCVQVFNTDPFRATMSIVLNNQY